MPQGLSRKIREGLSDEELTAQGFSLSSIRSLRSRLKRKSGGARAEGEDGEEKAKARAARLAQLDRELRIAKEPLPTEEGIKKLRLDVQRLSYDLDGLRDTVGPRLMQHLAALDSQVRFLMGITVPPCPHCRQPLTIRTHCRACDRMFS